MYAFICSLLNRGLDICGCGVNPFTGQVWYWTSLSPIVHCSISGYSWSSSSSFSYPTFLHLIDFPTHRVRHTSVLLHPTRSFASVAFLGQARFPAHPGCPCEVPNFHCHFISTYHIGIERLKTFHQTSPTMGEGRTDAAPSVSGRCKFPSMTTYSRRKLTIHKPAICRRISKTTEICVFQS
jgi:hypothetical protein